MIKTIVNRLNYPIIKTYIKLRPTITIKGATKNEQQS